MWPFTCSVLHSVHQLVPNFVCLLSVIGHVGQRSVDLRGTAVFHERSLWVCPYEQNLSMECEAILWF